MELFFRITKDHYIDSLETLNETSILNDQPGIETGFVGMATRAFKETASEIGLLTPEIDSASDADYVVVAKAESKAAFEAAVEAVNRESWDSEAPIERTYSSIEAAVRENGQANLCQIAVPGEHALTEVKRALNAGLHWVSW